jgi:hypothetical protein
MLRLAIIAVLSFPAAAFFSWVTPLPYLVSYIFAFIIMLNSKS